MTDQRYLVTGGAGFIGSHLTGHLLSQGHPVTVLDNFSSGTHDNLSGFEGDLRIVEGSITTPHDAARIRRPGIAPGHRIMPVHARIGVHHPADHRQPRLGAACGIDSRA